MNELRDDARYLTRQLTSEIQRQAKIQQKRGKCFVYDLINEFYLFIYVLGNHKEFVPITRKFDNLFSSDQSLPIYKANSSLSFEEDSFKTILSAWFISYALLIILFLRKIIRRTFFIKSLVCSTFSYFILSWLISIYPILKNKLIGTKNE